MVNDVGVFNQQRFHKDIPTNVGGRHDGPSYDAFLHWASDVLLWGVLLMKWEHSVDEPMNHYNAAYVLRHYEQVG